MPSATLRSAVDTYVSSTAPSTNYATSRRLSTLTGVAYTYVYFSSPVPRGAIVTSAKLRLRYYSTAVGASTVTVSRLSSSLSATRVNWNTRLAFVSSTSPQAAPAGPAGTIVELDVKSLLQSVANGSAWHGFRVSSADQRWWSSVEGTSAWRPELVVSWSEAPHKPTTLSPDGNDAVSAAAPLLRFQVTDTLGDTTISAVRVQTSATTSFTAPAFDSGWVATGDPELDLSILTAPAFPGLAENQSIYWRVQVRDGAALESVWSDDAQLRRVSHKAVTIINPAPGTPGYVNEPTPPILWNFGGTQVQWEVQLTKWLVTRDDPVSVLSSGRRTSTEQAWTVPDGFLKDVGPYRVEVRVWDNLDRDPTDAYAVGSTEFELRPDLSVVPVTDLAVTHPFAWPAARLSWSRATAPDKWVIERDGLVVDSSVTASESATSGTSHRWYDHGASPRRDHTWIVRAVVNGKMSGDSGTITSRISSRGIWLMSPSRSIRVWIAGDDDGEWAEPEEATALYPLQATKVVRRVQGVRNYEGSIAGQLLDAFGRTAADYEADLRVLQAEPDEWVYLSVADYSLRVLLGNIQFVPTRHIPPSRLVSLDFWEV